MIFQYTGRTKATIDCSGALFAAGGMHEQGPLPPSSEHSLSILRLSSPLQIVKGDL
jgi:hypothetical protein